MTLETLAADIVSRIPDMMKDSPLNNAEQIKRMIEAEIAREKPTRAEIVEALRVRKREWNCPICGEWMPQDIIEPPTEHRINCPHHLTEERPGV